MRRFFCWLAPSLFLLIACQKGQDSIPTVCAKPEPTSGVQIMYSELIDPSFSGRYVLRGIALGVDGKSNYAQDIFVSRDQRVSAGAVRCKMPDGGISSFHLRDVDPNLNIPLDFSASDGHYTKFLDLRVRSQGTEGRVSPCELKSLAKFMSNLRAGGASVHIYRDADGIFLNVEKMAGEPYIYRAKIFFEQLSF